MDKQKARQYLTNFDLKQLFREELGWDNYNAPIAVQVDGAAYTLQPIAQKRGVVALRCAAPDGIPTYAARRKIERQVAKLHREHFVVYTDGGETQQIWQWVRQAPGKPLASREHRFYRGQPGDSLLQKLEKIKFSLKEEESGIGLPEVTIRVRAAFDVEHTTRRFFDLFKRERDAFEKFLKGIPDDGLKRWYISVMLNRLMFIYFIQRKEFLDGNTDYLRHKLVQSQAIGKDRYYREFLCPLFFEGFAKPVQQRTAEMNTLLGNVPYLNGGIFQQHQVEQLHGRDIQVPEAAFTRLFDFFDRYQWYLDDRPLAKDTEINPDVLGYIFEKYVNQREMGAYYTKEDITDYISKNTIIPFLFDRARQDCRIAFEGDNSVWTLLQADPDRYIYPAMQKGVRLDLPPEIAAGIGDVSQRTLWNTPTPDEYALPTEIWRETVARRQRYEEVWLKLVSGEFKEINDLITYNLDIQQFAQDVIENCEGPELLRAFWQAINGVTVLDPTCGSGAFLFAALNILESLYEACLERMRAFVDELPAEVPAGRFADFKQILADIERHPSPKYFVYKSIIVNNLYGVDIMAEAVEIAKLRLFLKLVAQVERAEDVEPLPDIDFNIRAGNTLVGFTSLDDVERAIRGVGTHQERMLLLPEDEALLAEIKTDAVCVEQLFSRFHQMQTAHDGSAGVGEAAAVKAELSECLGVLEDRLNRLLAQQYGVDPGKAQGYQSWLQGHQPFHWFVGFYGIMSQGGFDVAIGNPPYVEYRKVKHIYRVSNYRTDKTQNLYAFVMERVTQLQESRGRCGVILPVSAISLSGTTVLRKVLYQAYRYLWSSSYSFRPAKLFEGVNLRLAIVLGGYGDGSNRLLSSRYNLWYSETRSSLFNTLNYCDCTDISGNYTIPKVGDQTSLEVIKRVRGMSKWTVGAHLKAYEGFILHYHRSPLYWIRAMDFEPYFKSPTRSRSVHHFRDLSIDGIGIAKFVGATLNSSLFFFWFMATGNCRNLTGDDVTNFPVGIASENSIERASDLFDSLMIDYRKNSVIKQRGNAQLQEFYPSLSKPVMDNIDQLLAQHYGFTDEELDFIINYDIKYRMGDELQNDGEEEE